MSDNEIIDIILDNLKKESPRYLITDILAPRHLWNEKEEKIISNIITLLKDKQLIKINGGDTNFPGTDMKIGIKGNAIELINQYGSYSSFLQSRIIDKMEKIEIKADNIHVSNNFGNYAQSSSHNFTLKTGDKRQSIAKQIIIGIAITVIGGLLVWYFTTYK